MPDSSVDIKNASFTTIIGIYGVPSRDGGYKEFHNCQNRSQVRKIKEELNNPLNKVQELYPETRYHCHSRSTRYYFKDNPGQFHT